MNAQLHPSPHQLSVGVLIRFSNSERTLPTVLHALQQQTLQPNLLLGIDNQSSDQSPHLITAAGGHVLPWAQPYSHPATLNFGIAHLPTDLILVLSSHTVLQQPDTLQRMVDAMHDPATCCVSGKWDNDPFYSDSIDFKELQAKGLKFGAIYSNSMGMLRRRHWQTLPFDESLSTAEDYAWAIAQLQHGRVCRRLQFRFDYQRSGPDRRADFARVTFALAKKHQLQATWLGVRPTLVQIASNLRKSPAETRNHLRILSAWITASHHPLKHT